MPKLKVAALAGLALAPCMAFAAPTEVNLSSSSYELTGSYALDLTHSPKAWEASSVTWNPDNGHLYVIEDEAHRVYELGTNGTVISSMTLSGYGSDAEVAGDTEGLTYVGGGQFVMAQERIQTVSRFSYVAGGTLVRDPAQEIALGPHVGNIGIEGVSYDPLTGGFITVKEKTPSDVDLWNIDFTAHTFTGGSLFNPAALGLADIADVQALSTMGSLAGQPDQQNLLLLSQESNRLLKVDRSGTVLGMYDLTSLGSNSIEGVTIDGNGNIYLVSEEVLGGDPHLWVLSPKPVPLPAGVWLLGSALGSLGMVRRRRRA